MTPLKLLPLIALMGALPACSTFDPCQGASCAGDLKLSADVRNKLDALPALRFDNIDVYTVHNVVHLDGLVDTANEKQEAKAITGAVPGVAHIVDNIGIRNDVGG
jgi:osmotically-inducible protein OsmY